MEATDFKNLLGGFWGWLGLEAVFEVTEVKISKSYNFYDFSFRISLFLFSIKFQKACQSLSKRAGEIFLTITFLKSLGSTDQNEL